MKRLKVLELFSGIGACSKALTNLGISYEIVDAVEIDKFAIKSFNAIHGTNFESQDIVGWDKDIECDLIMHGSPCQDFSFAGKQAGGDKGSGTRSSLMYESLRIIEKLKPKYVIWENVKGILSKNHIHNYEAYLVCMAEIGYTNYKWVLNAKDFGAPQNRVRVYTVSRRDDLDTYPLREPVSIPLEKRLKDILEPTVDESYYLSDEKVAKIKTSSFNQDPKCVKACDIAGKFESTNRVYSPEGVSPTLTTMGGGNQEPKIAEPYIAASRGREAQVLSPRRTEYGKQIRKNYEAGKIQEKRKYIQQLEPRKDGVSNILTSVQKDNYVIEPNLKFVGGIGERDWAKDGKGLSRNYPQGSRVYSAEGISSTLSSQGVGGSGGHSGNYQLPDFRVRKLTPKECWRLMGFDDDDYEKVATINSKTQLYKQAGNSIVVPVLEAILKRLLYGNETS